MDVGSVVAVLVLGAVVGALGAVVLVRRAQRLALEAALSDAGAEARATIAATGERLAARDDEIRALGARLEGAADELRAVRQANADERVARAGVEATLRDERERTAEKLALLSQARDDLSAHFKALAGDALETNRKRIAEQQTGALDQILKPLGEKLVAFEKKVEETYDKEAQQRSSLRQEVLNLQAATLQINEDARNLTLALKGESKTRGNWGEVVLERVLERSGLVKGIEYHVQHTIRHEDGTISRPDIVIRLPDDKHVVIDSKVSLVAYDSYHAATDKATQEHHGRQHVEGMRRHAKSLHEKNYQGGKGIDSPDFVAMFVPIEPAFSLASTIDAEFFLEAWDRKVVIVTPSTLLALLMTVQTLWQRDKQTKNAIQIAEESGKLHDQFVKVVEALKDVGKHLRRAQDAFDLTENRFVAGRGNLVTRSQQLKEMGAKIKRQMPDDLIERAAAEHEAPVQDDPPAASKPGLALVPPSAEA